MLPACQKCNRDKAAKTFLLYRIECQLKWLVQDPTRKSRDFQFWGEANTDLWPSFISRDGDIMLDEQLLLINGPGHTIGATGHRPGSIPGFQPGDEKILRYFAKSIMKNLPDDCQVISGMALGWDTYIAQAALDSGLDLICAIPFPLQPSRWPARDIANWRDIIKHAARVEYVSNSYSPEAFQKRNKWIVDRSAKIYALWNGQPGGTGNCMAYVKSQGKPPVINLWNLFQKERANANPTG